MVRKLEVLQEVGGVFLQTARVVPQANDLKNTTKMNIRFNNESPRAYSWIAEVNPWVLQHLGWLINNIGQEQYALAFLVKSVEGRKRKATKTLTNAIRVIFSQKKNVQEFRKRS